MASTYMHAIFCDDLRHELGNKFSYMGVYSGAMFVHEFPFTLAKLGVAFWLVDHAKEPRTELSFIVYLDDNEIGRVDVPISETAVFQQPDEDMSGEKVRVFNAGIIISPLQIEKDCRLKARALLDGEEIKGGTLVIRALPQSYES